MRLLTLLVVFGSFAVRAGTVLVFVDERLHARAEAEIAEWQAQVNSEGNYTVDLRVVDRTGHLAKNRYERLQEHRALVHELQPAAVQLFGSVPIGVTGWQGVDGHGARCVYTDAPYMIAWETPLTDKGEFGTKPGTPSWSNTAGDHRWDQNTVTTYERPAARVDFSELPFVGPHLRIPSGCLKGTPICPAIDEFKAFKEYLRRNLEYRRGEWIPPREAWMVGNLWGMNNGMPRKFTRAAIPDFKWVEELRPEKAAGRDVFFLFNNVDRDHVFEFVDADCRWVRAVWANSYRSFTMELYESGGVFRRWLQYALVSTWGPAWWVVPPDAVTVGDAITATARKQRRWDMLYTVGGDVTLPLQVKAGERRDADRR